MKSSKLSHDFAVVHTYFTRLDAAAKAGLDFDKVVVNEIKLLKDLKAKAETLTDKPELSVNERTETLYGNISLSFGNSAMTIANLLNKLPKEQRNPTFTMLKEYIEACSFKFIILSDLISSGILSLNFDKMETKADGSKKSE